MGNILTLSDNRTVHAASSKLNLDTNGTKIVSDWNKKINIHISTQNNKTSVSAYKHIYIDS
jgi:hypothetical protein